MVGFVLAYVEPFAIIVGRSPRPFFIDGEEPVVVALFEFGEGSGSHFGECVDVVAQRVAFNGFTAGVAEFAGGGETFCVGFGPVAPLAVVEGVQLVEAFGGGQVEEHGADGVGFVVVQVIELLYGQTFYRHQYYFAHPVEHGYQRTYLWRVAGFRADDVVKFREGV